MRVSFSKIKFFNCAILTSILFLFTFLPTFAQENIISSVTIAKAKNPQGNFELNIDSTSASSYKMKIENENSVIFELKNSILAQDAGTYYDEVNDIDSVAVKQENNKVNIYLQGKNVQDTELIFVNSVLDETIKNNNKKIVINRPINQYKSTRHSDLDEQDEMQDWNDNSFNLAHLSNAILENLKDSAMGIIMIFLAILALIAIIIKNISKRFEQDTEPLIGLSNNLNLQSKIPSRVVDYNLPDIEKRSEALRAAQEQLAHAHQKYQDYLKDKYNNNAQEKINNIGLDSIKRGIALNQYQKSTQNPYQNQQVLKMNKDFTQKTYANENFQIPKAKKIEPQNFSSPYIKKVNNPINRNQKTSSMKFLESVSKIYEQSGRSDLADGLKNSIIKANLK